VYRADPEAGAGISSGICCELLPAPVVVCGVQVHELVDLFWIGPGEVRHLRTCSRESDQRCLLDPHQIEECADVDGQRRRVVPRFGRVRLPLAPARKPQYARSIAELRSKGVESMSAVAEAVRNSRTGPVPPQST
jgi:hypothetical protein